MPRIYAISDIHVDHVSNYKWLHQLSVFDYQQDILILAGDVSDIPKLLEDSFRCLKKRFNRVLFVPGNHELWVRRCGSKSSLAKLDLIYQIAKDCEIDTEQITTNDLRIIPLLSWYDYSFASPGTNLEDIWMDFRNCNWGDWELSQITNHLLSLNQIHSRENKPNTITVSHFLPRIDVMPSYIPPEHRLIYPVLGSNKLDNQIRALNSSIHVYGHSHVNRTVNLDNVTYINNAYGYPRETRISNKALKIIHTS